MLISALVIVMSTFGVTKPASAHFELEDTNTGMKALFHITPNHEPIAGQESVISFDFSNSGMQASDYTYALTLKSTKGEAVTVPLEGDGNVRIAHYTFPSQGFYDISLTATPKDGGSVSKLHYGLRVSRGTIMQQEIAFGPTEVAALAAVALIALSAIIASFINDSKKRKHKKTEASNNISESTHLN